MSEATTETKSQHTPLKLHLTRKSAADAFHWASRERAQSWSPVANSICQLSEDWLLHDSLLTAVPDEQQAKIDALLAVARDYMELLRSDYTGNRGWVGPGIEAGPRVSAAIALAQGGTP